jgi:hypothetical protein
MRRRWAVGTGVVLGSLVLSAAGPPDEAAAVAKIKKRGATVVRDETRPGGPVESVNHSGPGTDSATDADLKIIRRFKDLRFLSLHATRVTDRGMKELKDLRRLEWLHLGYTRITDAGVKELEGLTKLRRLDLSGTRVTDRSIESLKAMKSLRSLLLFDTRVTDAGIKELRAALPRLDVAHRHR